ncbi:MAG: type II CAAX endopeptidase family protein [Gemmataceae bacterium]
MRSRSTVAFSLVALVLPTAVAWVYFVALATGGEPNPRQQAVYAAGKVVQFGLPVVWLLLVARAWPRPDGSVWKGVPLGVAFGVLVAVVMIAAYRLWLARTAAFATTPAKVLEKVRELGVDTPGRFLALAVFLSGMHSLLEEYYWRWFVFGRLREWLPRTVAIVVSAVGFTAHHVIVLGVYFPGRWLQAVVPFAAGIAVGGAFWAWLYDRSGSLLGPWLGHLLIDAAIFVIGWDLLLAASR